MWIRSGFRGGSGTITEGGECHADDLPEADDRAEKKADEIEPFGVQVVVEDLAEEEAEENGRWNDESDFGVASQRDDGILTGRLRHAGIVIQLGNLALHS